LISVVIPVRDGARYVGESIDSALAQTYGRTECVVVDDGSSDGTAAVLASYGERIRVVGGSPGGTAAARNVGVSAAAGRFIAFLDADDVWLSDKLEAQMSLLLATPSCGAVLTGYRVVDHDLRPRRDVPTRDLERRIIDAILFSGPGLAWSSTALVDRGVFEEVGGYHGPLRMGEDLDLLWRIWRRSTVLAIERPLALYRRHPGQATAGPSDLEHDATVLLERVLADGFPRSRATAFASLHSYLGWRYLAAGDVRSAVPQLRRAYAAHRPSVLLPPLHAARRRAGARRPLGRPNVGTAPS
jgi:glycosyltransferase involved in cell wall biosynthesis